MRRGIYFWQTWPLKETWLLEPLEDQHYEFAESLAWRVVGAWLASSFSASHSCSAWEPCHVSWAAQAGCPLFFRLPDWLGWAALDFEGFLRVQVETFPGKIQKHGWPIFEGSFSFFRRRDIHAELLRTVQNEWPEVRGHDRSLAQHLGREK